MTSLFRCTRRLRAFTASLILAAPLTAQQPPAAPTHMGLGAAPPPIRTEADLRRFLDDLEAQQWALDRAANLEAYAQWKGLPNHQVEAMNRLINQLSTRRDYAKVIDQWKGRVQDSLLTRRLQVQANYFLAAKADPALAVKLGELQTAIQDTFRQFRYQLDGRELTQTQLGIILDTTADRSIRRRAFEAIPGLSAKTSPMIRQAMAMTDRMGRQEGFPSGAAAQLSVSGLTPTQVLRDLTSFEQATRPTYEALLTTIARDLKVEKVEAWDLDYWFHLQEQQVSADAYPGDQAMQRIRALATGMGFNVDSLPITVTIYDVPTGGIAFPIRPAYEARLLSNPFPGGRFYSTLFHEYGHTLHAVLIRPDLPLSLLSFDPQPSTEGLGETLGHFAFDRRFLARTGAVNPEQAAALERLGKLEQLLWLRRTIGANAYAEVQAYLDLTASFDSIFTDSYRRFVGVDLPPGDYASTRDLFGTVPLYYPAYLYANMFAAQLREAMRKEFGTEDLSREPRVAGWLTRNFYGPGQSIPWMEKVRRATGRPLDSRALVEFLAVE
ncbi:MAG TPA: M3 family metallopeptidase [Gemmatimonadales bacterium]|nr:M3 family metallopeptidase [Gemmatimonadales bacterium]